MFSARRKPKRIARDEPERSSNDEEEETNNGPVVRRPGAPAKTKSKLRTSFAPDEAEDNDNNSDAPTIIKPKPKPRLGQTASSQSLPRFNLESRDREDPSVHRPSYSKSALEELRNSTPSTPKDLSVYDPSSSGAEEGIRDLDLDLASKFGVQSTTKSAIPSATEIAEKKSRRARLALEQQAQTTTTTRSSDSQDYISLSVDDNELTNYDSDGEFKPRRLQVGTYLRPEPVEKDTRLLRDDEDVLEGFDDYTEDAESARLTMGRKALLQAQRQDRAAMRELIEHGGSGGSDSESDSEVERNQAYVRAQTARGMDGLSAAKEEQRRAGAMRPRQPREVTPVPKLSVALGKLRERIARVEIERVRVERRREEVRKEKIEILKGQEHIQKSLIEAGEELERVLKRQAEEQKSAVGNGGNVSTINGSDGATGRGRGLDSMGLTPEPT